MQGEEAKQAGMLSYVTFEQRIPTDHPLRGICVMVDRADAGICLMERKSEDHADRR